MIIEEKYNKIPNNTAAEPLPASQCCIAQAQAGTPAPEHTVCPLILTAEWPLMSEWSLGLPAVLSNMPHALRATHMRAPERDIYTQQRAATAQDIHRCHMK